MPVPSVGSVRIERRIRNPFSTDVRFELLFDECDALDIRAIDQTLWQRLSGQSDVL